MLVALCQEQNSLCTHPSIKSYNPQSATLKRKPEILHSKLKARNLCARTESPNTPAGLQRNSGCMTSSQPCCSWDSLPALFPQSMTLYCRDVYNKHMEIFWRLFREVYCVVKARPLHKGGILLPSISTPKIQASYV